MLSDIPVTVDPDMQPGTWELRSGESRVRVKIRDGWMYGEYPGIPFITDEQARGMAEMMRQRAAVDPEFAEDCESLSESMPYIIRHDGAGRPIVCECCGTYVFDPLEAHSSQPRTWTRAIWEAEAGRKHTLRRCTWKRDRALPPAAAPIGLGPGPPVPPSFRCKPPLRSALSSCGFTGSCRSSP